MRQENGFTLLEVMLTVSILAILLTVAVPSVSSFMDKQRAISATEAIFSQLTIARSKAVSLSQNVSVRVAGGDNTTNWAIGVSTNENCDPTLTDAGAANACVLPLVDGSANVLMRISSADYPGVALDAGGDTATITYNPLRGTIDVGQDGTARVLYGTFEFRIIVGLIGRASICSKRGAGGYPKC